jgi:hypothetical protein
MILNKPPNHTGRQPLVQDGLPHATAHRTSTFYDYLRHLQSITAGMEHLQDVTAGIAATHRLLQVVSSCIGLDDIPDIMDFLTRRSSALELVRAYDTLVSPSRTLVDQQEYERLKALASYIRTLVLNYGTNKIPFPPESVMTTCNASAALTVENLATMCTVNPPLAYISRFSSKVMNRSEDEFFMYPLRLSRGLLVPFIGAHRSGSLLRVGLRNDVEFLKRSTD